MVDLATRLSSRLAAPVRPRGTSSWPTLVPLLATSLFVLAPLASFAQSPPADACLACHLQAGDDRLTKPARDFASDVHHARGFTCADCHGGDPRTTGMDAMAP